jgi:hypothetical protein
MYSCKTDRYSKGAPGAQGTQCPQGTTGSPGIILDKIKNYRLHDDTIVMLYGSVVSITFLLITMAYENLKLIR